MADVNNITLSDCFELEGFLIGYKNHLITQLETVTGMKGAEPFIPQIERELAAVARMGDKLHGITSKVMRGE